METKKCTKCGEVKGLSVFYKNKRTKDGLQYWCKLCHELNCKGYRKKNKDKVAAYQKKYRNENAEKIKEHMKKDYIKNKSKYIARAKKHYKINGCHIREYAKEYAQNPNNRERINQNRRRSAKRNVSRLGKTYIIAKLKLNRSECTPELIELKRMSLKLYRATK